MLKEKTWLQPEKDFLFPPVFTLVKGEADKFQNGTCGDVNIMLTSVCHCFS